MITSFITPILKSLVVTIIWLALIGAIYSRIAPFFALNCIFSPANEATLETKQPIRFQGLFKVTIQIAGKCETRVSCSKFCYFCSQNLFFPPQKLMNLISNQLSTTSIKYLNWPSPVFERFQNGCNKVVIEPRVVQFWSEIILVISNRTRAARSFHFEITYMISAQIAFHLVQLPSFIIMTLVLDLGVILLGEIRCLSLFGIKGVRLYRTYYRCLRSCTVVVRVRHGLEKDCYLRQGMS